MIVEAANTARNIGTAPDVNGVWAQLKAFAQPFGYQQFAAFRWSGDNASAMLEPEVSPQFASSIGRFATAGAQALRGPSRLSAIDTGETPHDGWCFPIDLRSSARGIVATGGETPDMSNLLGSALHLLSLAAFKRFDELSSGMPVKAHNLTAREVECLRWVALGKTDSEIATILDIGRRTVRFHVENAKAKLHVATRVQAVAEALRRQAIVV